MKRIYTTTLRLDLNDADGRRARELLRGLDRKQYHSVSKAVSAAVNAFFGRQEQLRHDPYLETREKEDAFLRGIKAMLLEGLRTAFIVPPTIQPPASSAGHPAAEGSAESHEDEDLDAAISFADSF